MKLPTHIGNTRIVATDRKYAYIEQDCVRIRLPRFEYQSTNWDGPILIDGIYYSPNGQVIGEAKIVNEK